MYQTIAEDSRTVRRISQGEDFGRMRFSGNPTEHCHGRNGTDHLPGYSDRSNFGLSNKLASSREGISQSRVICGGDDLPLL